LFADSTDLGIARSLIGPADFFSYDPYTVPSGLKAELGNVRIQSCELRTCLRIAASAAA